VQGANRVEFFATDQPARWFKTEAAPIAGTQSLAVIRPNDEVVFSGKSRTGKRYPTHDRDTLFRDES